MITLALFYMSRTLPYGERPSDLYMGTCILDVGLLILIHCAVLMFTGNW